MITGCTSKEAMEKEHYQEQIKIYFEEIVDITDEADTTTAEGIQTLIDEITPIYNDIGNLTPPSELKEAHNKLKSSCDASIEILTMSEDILSSIDTDNPTAEDTKKIEELQEKIDDYDSSQQDMEDAINEIFGLETETESQSE